MAYDIFISYRRKGGYETAKHLYDLLTRDNYSVSFDVDTLRNGDFDTELLKRIDECTDFILILNEGALDRCLEADKKEDWLRQELSYALEKGKNIIPIMLAGFTEFPENLPADIAKVQRKNGPKYDHYYFDDFYRRLKEMFFETPPAETKAVRGDCILKIRSNMNCKVFVDDELTVSAEANKLTKLELNKGTYSLRFVSEENEADVYSCDYKMSDAEELIDVDLDNIVNDRLEKLELVTFKKNGKFGFKDKNTNKDIIQPIYDKANPFAEGLACVELNDKVGYIDKTGKVIIPLKFDDACSFSNGLAKVSFNNSKYGFIDKDGKIVISLKYDDAGFFYAEGLACVELEEKFGYIDKTGKVIIPLKYDDAYSFNDGLAIVLLNNKWGFIDKTGKEVIPLKYDNVSDFKDGIARVELDGEEFYIDRNGNRIK